MPEENPKRRKRRKFSSEEEKTRRESQRKARVETWVPKTALGKKVKNGEVTSLEEIFEQGLKILEPQIVDSLVEELQEKTMDLKKTARVIRSGRQFAYRATVLVGNKNNFVGVGIANDKERLAAVQKAASQARLNIVLVRRGCGSWECVCGTQHSVPFKVTGRCGSVKISLRSAPKGVGLVIGDNAKDVLRFAGIKDVWAETRGHTATRLNFVHAVIDALQKTNRMKVSASFEKKIDRIKTREG
ncbi:30S ribosomal protein S5 [Candidatus Micrarchaeota archaeon]|nr:30S ribosomal protein S5 [Candidatus Micrarchaeota archaeon]MBU1930750.1 30S ribosomal protein S5 [Candidatus Micrarchaeota archaeon]